MRAVHLMVFFLGLDLLALSPAGGVETQAQAESLRKAERACQHWEEWKCFTDDYSKLSLVGSLGFHPDSYWQAASRNIDQFPIREKVIELFFNAGYISGASLECLAHFPNVEEITLGISPEGVTVPVQDFRSILKFPKLKYLHFAIHGVQNEHFRILSEHQGLKGLTVSFGSIHMLGNDTCQTSRLVPASLNDEAAKHISRMKSLRELIFYAPRPEDGKVSFSDKAMTTLLEAAQLKRKILIDSRNFTKEGLEVVKKTKLPNYLELYESGVP